MKLKRVNYLLHRWSGIILGLLVLMWFTSGIVMMYYPYPVLTESERNTLLEPFSISDSLIGFSAAIELARLRRIQTRRAFFREAGRGPGR